MWGYGSTARSSIDEANKHLQALMDRITELEQTVNEQRVAIVQKDEATQMQFREITKDKDKEIKRLQKQVQENQRMLDKANDACREKDMLIARLKEKSNVLSELVQLRPSMDKLTHFLHSAAKLCLNDSDEEKNKSKPFPNNSYSSSTSNHHPNSLRRSGHSMKAAHSMINLSTTNEFADVDDMVNSRHASASKQVKDRLAKSLLTGSTYDLRDADEDYMNSAVMYDVDSPVRSGGKELYL